MSKWKFDAHFCNGKIRKLLELMILNYLSMNDAVIDVIEFEALDSVPNKSIKKYIKWDCMKFLRFKSVKFEYSC